MPPINATPEKMETGADTSVETSVNVPEVVDATAAGTNESLEEKGFNASVDSLVPEASPNPLEDKIETGGDLKAEEAKAGAVEEGGKSEAEVDAEAEKVADAIKPFIGEMSEEQVLEMLGKVDGMESAVFDKVSAKVFGKFGEIGQQLKELQEREFTFDPEKLTKLKEVDEGIAEALADDLKEAFKGQQFDSGAVLDTFKETLMGDLNPYIEQRLLAALVPTVDEVVKTDEFSDWFFNEADQGVRDTFKAWDDRERMDGVQMAQAFKAFEAFKTGKASAAEKKAAVKKDVLARSVEEVKGSGATTATRRAMTEEEAFNARLSE